MDPVKHPNENVNYRGPEPGIGDLSCERRRVDHLGRTAVFSLWKPNAEERAALAAGAVVELGIWYHEPIPPVSIMVKAVDVSERVPGPPEVPRGERNEVG